MARPLRLEFAGALYHLRKEEAYWLAVSLMRRAGNLSLRELAEHAGVSPARASQIQAKIEQGKKSPIVTQVLRRYKLKD